MAELDFPVKMDENLSIYLPSQSMNCVGEAKNQRVERIK